MGCPAYTYCPVFESQKKRFKKVLTSEKTENKERSAYMYGFNGKETDPETDLQDYGMRIYNPSLGRFLSVDPLAANAPGWSPYRAFFCNPIRYTDPDGQWEVDSKGNLKAEKGDNAQTLAKFQGIKYGEALKQLKDQGYTVNSKGILNLKVGDQLTMNNVFTESINNSTSDYTLDNAEAGTSKTGPTPEDYYNCWGSACAGSQGKKIEVGVGIPDPATFDANLNKDYTPTTEANAQFGKTVLHFSNASGTQHGAVYYGKNKAGEIYVYTKNGWYLKPEVMKLSELLKRIPDYGTVQGVNPGETGYYQPK
jgi:RHS repeat-associated protein